MEHFEDPDGQAATFAAALVEAEGIPLCLKCRSGV